MRRTLILSLPLLALPLSVPWAFASAGEGRLFGFPYWAVFAIGMAALFAALVAFLTGRFWELSAAGDETDCDGQR